MQTNKQTKTKHSHTHTLTHSSHPYIAVNCSNQVKKFLSFQFSDAQNDSMCFYLLGKCELVRLAAMRL